MIKNHIYAIRLAFSMMTTLPFFRFYEFREGLNGTAAAYYPVVGLALGGLVYTTYLLLLPYLPFTVLAVCLFAFYTVLYGALHLDGFVDTVDALHAPREAAERVMKEPTIGAMGAIYGFLLLSVKLSAFCIVVKTPLFVLVPMLSRFGGVVSMFLFRYAKNSGMGYAAKMELTKPLFLFSLTVTILVTVFVDTKLFWLILFAFAVSAFVGSILSRRFGGLSGDMYGFVIESSEAALLIALCVWIGI